MKTIHLFKISEDSKKDDIVEMIYDKLENLYIIRWKWSTMNYFMNEKFKSREEAYKFYKRRKEFVKLCN